MIFHFYFPFHSDPLPLPPPFPSLFHSRSSALSYDCTHPSFGELPGGALVEPTTTIIITQATLRSY